MPILLDLFLTFAKVGLFTLGIVPLSFLLIFLISSFLDNFLEIIWITNAFKGIRIAVGILILDAGLKMVKKMPKKKLPRAIMFCSFALMLAVNVFSLRLSTIVVMLTAGIISFMIFIATKPSAPEKGGPVQ